MTPFIALCLLITYVVWGTTYLAIRFALTDLPPFLMMGSRFLAAALLLARSCCCASASGSARASCATACWSAPSCWWAAWA